MSTLSRKSEGMLDEATAILQRIDDAFGPDDQKARHAREKFQEYVVDPSEETIMIGLMYLRWCLQNPGRIGVASDKLESVTCGECTGKVCEDGFILDDSSRDLWRPCHRLLPSTHDHWQQETGYSYR